MPKLVTVAVVREPGADFEDMDVLLDIPRAGEVLVRVEAVGICHAEISSLARDTPRSPFDRINDAARAAASGEVVKSVLLL